MPWVVHPTTVYFDTCSGAASFERQHQAAHAACVYSIQQLQGPQPAAGTLQQQQGAPGQAAVAPVGKACFMCAYVADFVRRAGCSNSGQLNSSRATFTTNILQSIQAGLGQQLRKPCLARVRQCCSVRTVMESSKA
eukprot:GHUV01040560.1.p2 GENE.GHUV01040560.1~~GHUV01040560.1.p2  ORF type:complete len:136 (-),score=28.70 GHUV01040560.1:358-765(-)